MTKMVSREPPVADYFKQEFYFSRSRGEFVSVEDMPFQQALFSHRKLLNEFGVRYKDTRLYKRFVRKLCPSYMEIRRQLERYGKACHVIYEPGQKSGDLSVRNKFYKASTKKVTTHKVTTAAGPYMEATVPVPAKKRTTTTQDHRESVNDLYEAAIKDGI